MADTQLCDLLHCLPSELDREDEVRIGQLIVYFAAKAQHEREQREMDRQRAELQGGY